MMRGLNMTFSRKCIVSADRKWMKTRGQKSEPWGGIGVIQASTTRFPNQDNSYQEADYEKEGQSCKNKTRGR